MPPNNTTSRIAARWLRSSFFSIGDLITFGKYKNKAGRIVRFDVNDKGQPLVEIEPIPKGRKKNKILGLFKIWNVAAIEKAKKEKAMDSVSQRVAGRFLLATGLPLGKSWDVGTARIHRYRDHFRVTDLTNAGKRGKKVREMAIGPSTYYKGDHDEWLDRMSKALPDYKSYDAILAFIKDILVDAPHEIFIHESVTRGVDVNPGGTTTITLKTHTGLEITSEPMSFMVKTHVPMNVDPKTNKPAFFQDTLYWPANAKRDSPIFYNWLKANLSDANKMTILDFMKLWDDLKIHYNYH